MKNAPPTCVEINMGAIRGFAFGLTVLLGVCASGITLEPLAAAAPTPRVVRSPAHQIASIEPPAGWELAAAPPSTRLVATWSHREGAKLTLVAERALASADVGAVFEQSRPSLERQGWVLGTIERQPTRVLVEARLDHGKRSARQLYLLEGGFVYVLTLVSPIEQTSARAKDFEDTVTSLRTSGSERPQP